MSCYQEPNSNIIDKVKGILDQSHYATKKPKHAKSIDTFDLTAKKGFFAFKAEVDKLDINRLTKVPTILNNLKTKVDKLDDRKLKTAPVDLKK